MIIDYFLNVVLFKSYQKIYDTLVLFHDLKLNKILRDAMKITYASTYRTCDYVRLCKCKVVYNTYTYTTYAFNIEFS